VRSPIITLAFLALLAETARADDRPLLDDSQRATELARARALEAQLDYDQALAVVDALLARGGARPDQYVELHLLAGRLAAGLDKPDLARDHFARVLALRPATTLPDGTSPKLTVPFAAARLHSTPLALRVVRQGDAIWLDGTDPLHLAIGIAVTTVGAEHTTAVVERASTRIAVPAQLHVIDVIALDAAGNQLWIDAAPARITLPPSSPRRPLYARWQTYAVTGGVALGIASIAAWRFQVAQDDWNLLHDQGGHDFTELEAIEQRGRRWGLTANIGFGVAAASAITAIVVGLRGRSSTEPVIAPLPGGGLAVGGRF
jgi:hypothetical protein